MRPSGTTPVASRMTRPKPPSAKRPRCTKCQSLATPCRAEYWHMGAITARLRSVSSRRVRGENRRDINLLGSWREAGTVAYPTSIGKRRWKQNLLTTAAGQPFGRIDVALGENGGLSMRACCLAALAVALLSTSALAQGKVLTGKEALGGWRDDAPGTTRHLTADDLEAPFVSKSASNTAQPVPMPEGQSPKVPDGYS